MNKKGSGGGRCPTSTQVQLVNKSHSHTTKQQPLKATPKPPHLLPSQNSMEILPIFPQTHSNLPIMALPHRKFLFAEPEKTPDGPFSSNCYLCYVCPDKCYNSSPPPQLSPIDDPERNHVSTVLILMLCILGVSFLVLSYLTFSRYRFRYSRRRNPDSPEYSGESGFLDENQGPVPDHHVWYIRSVGLPQPLIDSIALFRYKNGDGLIDGHDCSVCLNDFQEDERLRLLPKCSHAFHVGCIDTWLRSHKTCPVCRAPILFVNSGGSGSGSGMENIGSETRSGGTGCGTENSGGLRNGEDRTAEISSEKRVVSDLGDRRVGDDDRELRNLRRSVSMDFSGVSVMFSDSDTKPETIVIHKSGKSGSHARFLQKGPVSMKRSFSFSGKRSLRKNSRSQESIQIPEISLRNCGR